ncbi:helix-turn-helix transcriptional regulator [Clostridioides sp. ES-S-0006-03]|uniref:helix-turn-helix domain-containing protein n=1 Tax=Clostridioides sp. ES-S-0006-03 TaxID=2770775 RepID=UPI001D0C43A9|nr:helix-turn-helix transcriptional regulator [Clostridioides sp. ES-S-0006-03]
MNNRIKELRKIMNLSQKEFGKILNLSQNHISSIEKDTRTVTDRTINDICNKFNVNEKWLKNGEGEIYKDCLADLEVDDDVKEITNKLYELEQEDRDAILKMIELLQKKNK